MSRLRAWWNPGALALAILIAATVALLWRVLFAGRALYWGTVTLQFLPWHELGKRMLLAGQAPLWSHSLGLGAPLLANLQSAFLYLPNLLYLLLPVDVATGISMALHLAVAGGFAYLYARSLSVSHQGATLAGAAFGLGGYVVGRSQFVSMVDAYAWVPLVFWLADRALVCPRWTRIAALGAVLALQLSAGHAQTSYYTALALTAYVIWRSVGAFRKDGWRRSAARCLSALAGAAAVALLLSAAQVLPTAELAARSQRSGGVEATLALTYSLWPWRFLTLVSPNLFGSPATGDYWGYANYWEDHAYIGLLPLALAAYALVRAIRRRFPRGAVRAPARPVGFLAGLAGFALLLALGSHSPLYMAAFRWFPGMGDFQAPSRWLLMFAFPASILAGIGLDALTPSIRGRFWGRLMIAGALSMLAVSLAARGVLVGHPRTFGVGLAETSLVVLAIGIWLAAVPLGSPSRVPVWRWAAVGIAALDLVAFGSPLVPAAPRVAMDAATPTAEALSAAVDGARVMTTDTYEYREKFGLLTRFATWGPQDAETVLALRDSLLPDATALQGLDNAGHFDPLLDRRFVAFRGLVQSAPWETQRGLLARAGIGALVTDRTVDGATPDAALSGPPDDRRFVYTVDALPRARLVYRVRVEDDEPSAEECLSAIASDPDSVCIEGVAAPLDSGRPTAAVVARFGDNEVEMDLVAEESAMLVVAQMHYPGWQAWVDGRRVDVLRADTVFQAVSLTPGPHHVILRYRPQSWRIGACISVVSAIVLALCLFGGWLSRRRRRPRGATNAAIHD
jgi:hypothetical protein